MLDRLAGPNLESRQAFPRLHADIDLRGVVAAALDRQTDQAEEFIVAAARRKLPAHLDELIIPVFAEIGPG